MLSLQSMGFFAKLLPTRQTGDLGEDAAARYLETRGYTVLDRNWRFRQWELDLVCRDRDTVVFVEVKTRRAGSMASPGEALTPKKRARLVKAASQYLTKKNLWDAPCRFDLAAVTDNGASMDVELVQNAFDLTGMEL